MVKELIISSVICLIGLSCGNGNIKTENSRKLHYAKSNDTVIHTMNDDAVNGLIITTGNMQSARADHSSTLLNDGTVLICGGFAGSNTLSSAEIYNPVSKTFFSTGTLTTPRAGHSATRLPNGKILICGGYNGDYLSTTEIYDPQSKTFSPGPSMNSTRSGHTATMLDNGNILLAGGVGTGWTFLSSAEIYDVQTNKFISVGTMTFARESHTATLLKNGNVLITGGHRDRRKNIKIYSSTEIYDSEAKTFTSTGSLSIPRHKHDAILLPDGRVMVTGGSDQRDSRGVYSSTEIYDPNTSQFTSATDLNQPRYKHKGTSILLKDSNVLICGGSDRAEIYDFNSNKFFPVNGSMGTARLFSCATHLDNGQVLITGGYNEHNQTSNEAWLYVGKPERRSKNR